MDLQTAHATLAALPSHRAIYEFLKANNIKGTPFNGQCCPIANYLKPTTPHFIQVTRNCISVACGEEPDLALTLHMRDFLTLFDTRKIPDLFDCCGALSFNSNLDAMVDQHRVRKQFRMDHTTHEVLIECYSCRKWHIQTTAGFAKTEHLYGFN